MAVKILSGTESVEALVYDRVFVDQMVTRQELITNDSQDPKYTVEITYRMYALSLAGDMFFKNVPMSVAIPDFYAKAVAKAELGSMVFVNGLSATEAVVAEAIADEQDIGTEII